MDETPETPPETQPETGEAETTTVSEIENFQNELAEYKDKYMRLLAEQENMRKRLIKEREEMCRQSAKSVVVDFLTPIDQMENALKHKGAMSDEVKHWAVGFEMILGHFKDVLTAMNVAPMETLGKPIDPHLHHVSETEECEDQLPGTIIKETLKGYTMGDEVLRPAHVVVAKAKTEARPEEEEEPSDEIEE